MIDETLFTFPYQSDVSSFLVEELKVSGSSSKSNIENSSSKSNGTMSGLSDIVSGCNTIQSAE